MIRRSIPLFQSSKALGGAVHPGGPVPGRNRPTSSAKAALLALVASLSLLSSIAASFAQVPAPVPALPDAERRTSYSISASTCGCAVNFALFGDTNDFQNWVEVWLNGTRVNFNDATFGWTITSPSGPLSNLARPITDAVLTFNSIQTGTVQIVGARRPRRVSQFQENTGVSARNLNQALTDIVAQNRETWDKTNDVMGRGLFFAPGNTVGLMPNPTACQSALLGFDSTGLNPVCTDFAGFGTVGPNLVWAGPSSGSSALPTFRLLTGADLPSITNTLLANSTSGATFKGNPTASAGAQQDFTLASLPNLASPSSTLDLIPIVDHNTGTIKNVTPGAISSAGTLPTIANNQILANTSGGSATPTGTGASTWFDSAYCNTVGFIIVRTTGAWTCNNNIARNITWFGGVGNGATANDAAYDAAYASLSSIGGKIYFPTGVYLFTANHAKTMPASTFAIELAGDSAGGSILFWNTVSNGGLTFIASVNNNTFYIHDLTLGTTHVAGGSALHFIGVGGNSGQTFQSAIHNVQIEGLDIGPGLSTDFWTVAINLHNWPSVDIANTNTWGPHQAPGGTGGGIGLLFEGDAATSSFATILNISRSSFNFHVTAIELGDFWQGVTIDQANFNGEAGGSCINQISPTSGTLVLLTVTNTQFNCAGAQVVLSSPVINPTFIGNTISIFGNGQSGINLGTSPNGIVEGNEFNIAGTPAPTGTFCIVAAGSTGIILGNIFSQCATPINLQAGSSNWGVSQNRYIGTSSAANINNGTGNNLGTVTQ